MRYYLARGRLSFLLIGILFLLRPGKDGTRSHVRVGGHPSPGTHEVWRPGAAAFSFSSVFDDHVAVARGPSPRGPMGMCVRACARARARARARVCVCVCVRVCVLPEMQTKCTVCSTASRCVRVCMCVWQISELSAVGVYRRVCARARDTF